MYRPWISPSNNINIKFLSKETQDVINMLGSSFDVVDVQVYMDYTFKVFYSNINIKL